MRRFRHGSTLLCLALVALAALPPSTVSPRARASAAASSALPDAARGAVSRALGADQRAYWPRHLRGGRHSGLPSRFGRRGVTVTAAGRRAELQLRALGRGDAVAVLPAGAPRAFRDRVTYDRGGVREWYADGPLGLEQGFTLPERPGGAGALTLDVALRGGLRPLLDRDRLGATLLDRAGRPALRYAGLAVTDANGRPVRAWMERRDGAIRIHADDAGAAYPLVVDPFVSIATLTDNEAQTSEQLGSSVAIDGNVIVAAAPFTGNQGSSSKGTVYVFVKPASGWANATQSAKLEKAGANSGERIGSESVAIDGDTVVAGSEQSGSSAGPVFLFQKPGGGWSGTINPTAVLSRSDGGTDTTKSLVTVAVSGDTVVAAGGHNNVNTKAFVFVKPGGGWADATESAVLQASDAAGCCPGYGGWSLAIDGSTIAMGNPLYNTPAIGSGTTTGRVDVFVRPGGGWTGTVNQTARISASDGAASDELGESVAVEGDVIVAGAPQATVAGHAQQGAVYVFQKPIGGWVDGTNEVAKLTASNGALGDKLGRSVGVADDTVAAGSSQTGGSVYVFKRVGSGWTGALTETAQATNVGAGENQLALTPGAIGFRDARPDVVGPGGTTTATIVTGAPGSASNRGNALVLGDLINPPLVSTDAATGVGITGATLNGTVNPNNAATTYQFDYGPTIAYGTSVPIPAASAGFDNAFHGVSQLVGGLAPNTTYHFRIRASNAGGPANGGDRTFTTAPAVAPTGGTCAATGVGTDSATLCGTVNAQGTAVSDCHFEYGTTTGYGTNVPCSPTPSGATDQQVTAAVSGLQPGTTYHFRVVSTNLGGTLTTTDATFTTASLPATSNPDPGNGGGGGGTTTPAQPPTTPPPGGGGPPLLPPATTGPAGNPLGLPDVRCVDTRKFTFRLHHPTATKIVQVDVFINGKRKLHQTGAAIERLTLTRLPQSTFKVRIEAVQDSGAALISERTYRGCKKSRAHGRHRRPKRS